MNTDIQSIALMIRRIYWNECHFSVKIVLKFVISWQSFLNVFESLLKLAVSFITSVRLSVILQNLGSHWRIVMKIYKSDFI